jgi:hypothetical protein
MEIKVLRPLMRIFCFLPWRVAARDDSGAAEGVGLLAGGGEGARVRGEAGATADVPTIECDLAERQDMAYPMH